MASGPAGDFDVDNHVAALRAAAQRIVPSRKKMSIEDAEDIVRMEFERRGMRVPQRAQKQYARTMHRGPYWAWLHPRQARREGIRFTWRWSQD